MIVPNVTEAVDRAGTTACRGMKSNQPARQLILVVSQRAPVTSTDAPTRGAQCLAQTKLTS
jgi:hypothetical protein